MIPTTVPRSPMNGVTDPVVASQLMLLFNKGKLGSGRSLKRALYADELTIGQYGMVGILGIQRLNLSV